MNQMQLVADILAAVDRRGVKKLNCRQIGACIAEADSIIAEIRQAHRPAAKGSGLFAWLNSDDTGVSSRFMASALCGGPQAEYGHPYDPDDFGRCYRMLRAVLDPKPVSTMADHGAVWAGLAEAWGELEKLYEKEIKNKNGRAPKLYARMEEIIKKAEGRE